MMVAQRKFALTKVAVGDYILPSNDGKTIWRFATYTEGPSTGLDHLPRDRDFWGIWQWREDITASAYVDTADWDSWEFFGGMYESRADAIKAVLS